ncbi:MAG: hypothetical protein KGO52_06215 [Nitrospirota bacterium]|nr:hypothetical protein [Nitrospirota bacterium]MDE3035336.1 hypothetical protein [Nitrospirota bacterium]MDE3118625.1 hypothetical protein [Nitrospirota bacterium]MDE3225445.1 hypothetical protein [Nitrospirota bacterium]MDE3242296.1 hypothetical protein [Nitrospirota bacterium]
MSSADTTSQASSRKILDMLFGALVMGTVGTLLGLLMGGRVLPIAVGIGLVMGTVVGLFGGRRFLVSILIGTLLGGILAWLLAGAEKISVGAGAGAAMGGFLGVQYSMLMDMWAERKRAAADAQVPPGENREAP